MKKFLGCFFYPSTVKCLTTIPVPCQLLWISLMNPLGRTQDSAWQNLFQVLPISKKQMNQGRLLCWWYRVHLLVMMIPEAKEIIYEGFMYNDNSLHKLKVKWKFLKNLELNGLLIVYNHLWIVFIAFLITHFNCYVLI